MPDLPFITSNPAIDEYNRANKVASDEENAQLEQQGKVLSNKTAAFNLDTAQTQAPLKLRELTANTGIAETNAQYAGPKAKAEIARSGAETANAYSEIDNRRAQHHMEVFTKSLDLANSGDIASAKALAAQDGQQIAPGVLENAQVRAGLTQLTQRAQQLYPNRPKDQMVWLHSHISTLAQAAQSGQAVDPTAAFTQLPGDPEPQEVGGQGKTGETMQIIQSLMQPTPQNPQGMTFEQAVAAAHGHADEADLRRET